MKIIICLITGSTVDLITFSSVARTAIQQHFPSSDSLHWYVARE